jgi:hypothetical protein
MTNVRARKSTTKKRKTKLITGPMAGNLPLALSQRGSA